MMQSIFGPHSRPSSEPVDNEIYNVDSLCISGIGAAWTTVFAPHAVSVEDDQLLLSQQVDTYLFNVKDNGKMS